jgi:hypothetical protein
MFTTHTDFMHTVIQTMGAYLLWCSKFKGKAMPDSMLACLTDDALLAEFLEFSETVT